MDAADEAAFDMIERDVLDPYVLEQAVEYAVQRLSLRRGDDDRLMTIEAEIDVLEGELSRLTTVLASGANFEALLGAISERERNRTRLRRERDMLCETAKVAQVDPAEIRAKVTARLAEWRNLLRKETLWSRQIITKLLDGKITLTPTRDESGKPAYEMRAKLSLGGFFSGILCPSGVASPTRQPTLYLEGPLAA